MVLPLEGREVQIRKVLVARSKKEGGGLALGNGDWSIHHIFLPYVLDKQVGSM